MLPTKFRVNCLSVQEKKRKINFQDGGHGGHLGLLIETIFATFDLQDTLMLHTKFQVNWLFYSGVQEMKRQIDFKDSSQGGYFGFPIGTILPLFLITSHPDASYKVLSQLAFRFRRKSEKLMFKMAVMAAILDIRSEQF